MKTPEPELLPSPHDGSKVKFCDECDSGCHRIIGNGIEIDLLPTIRQGDSLENRRAICAERWNARVYPPRFIPETPAQVLEWLCSNYRSYEAFPDPQDDTYTLTAHDILSAFSWWDEDEYPPEVQAAIDRSKKEKVSLMPGGIGVCPNCLADIHDEITHCCHCGQRLDWSEE
ncbi:hypothetical protein [Oxalobacter formigenes]|uniref:hypothetical protein n=1 Tax=Oxalobacter formigenes TaxID=847 RepID=UPI00055D9B27|nr:hypothetical protein [Oxalobacter formigenes]ARQ46717.1 hypothetical protein BRW83_1978 [Oxalobacter formigenes]ARQ78783.1 hypothetical protein BRW84_09290 [Oxalobacter formigenes OXCC13]MCZ4062614.1 hypothetical protein [Oxalobacter formigenes]QDX32640.1 hypothetical protein FPZ51_03070 [Oxalobacter formigenes]WAW06044.1 hypothetical protein NB639_01180 [Oxalobacter formigenes]